MADADDDDEDLDWDEWMKLSDAQQDAILDREMKAHSDWYDRLPLRAQQRYIIRGQLESCLTARKWVRRDFAADFWREKLKETQRRMLKSRIWKQTGVYPGEG